MVRRAWRRALALAGVGESIALIHDQLTWIREYQRNVASDVGALLELYRSKLRGPPERYCTVMLLWTGESVTGSKEYPGFASTTVTVPADGSASGTLQPQVPVPAGAWLIGFNCYLQTVLVGNDLMDVAMPDRSPMCRLSKSVHLGVLVRFSVVPA